MAMLAQLWALLKAGPGVICPLSKLYRIRHSCVTTCIQVQPTRFKLILGCGSYETSYFVKFLIIFKALDVFVSTCAVGCL